MVALRSRRLEQIFGAPLDAVTHSHIVQLVQNRVGEAYDITARFVLAHGAPVYHGDPAGLGIADLDRPEWGEACTIHSGEVPVFWACGVTSQVAVMHALEQGAISWAIGHAPGHMFITDLRAEETGRG